MDIAWNPPTDWMRIKTIDAHAAGEPLRVIVDGLPPLPGDTILEKRRYLPQEQSGFPAHRLDVGATGTRRHVRSSHYGAST